MKKIVKVGLAVLGGAFGAGVSFVAGVSVTTWVFKKCLEKDIADKEAEYKKLCDECSVMWKDIEERKEEEGYIDVYSDLSSRMAHKYSEIDALKNFYVKRL